MRKTLIGAVSLLLLAGSGFAQSEPADDSLVGKPAAAVEHEHDQTQNHDAAPAPTRFLPEGSLAKVMDSFLRAYAADKPEWRSDVQPGVASADSEPPEGYQKTHSALSGWYYFRPRTSDSLSVEERRAILRDKRFPAFLAQMRQVADGKTPPIDPEIAAAANPKAPTELPPEITRAELLAKLLAGRRPPPDTIHFTITPEELMLPGPIVVTDNSNTVP